MDLIRVLWRRKVAIVAAALICACAAVMIGKSLTPRYAATAQLYVDPRELQLVDRELTPRSQDISGLSMVVESQARLITSNNVLLRVIEDTKLERDPEFGGETTSLMGTLMKLISFGARSSVDANAGKMAALLDALNRHINVKRTDRTYVVDIEVWSTEPAKAAMLANAISAAYLAESKQSQADAARRATNDLSGRLKELQDRLRTSENALAVYKAQNNFVGTQDTLVSDQQLSAMTQRLAAAHALTLDAQAKYDQIEASQARSHRCRRDPRGAAVSDHRQSARAIRRGAAQICRTLQRARAAASVVEEHGEAGRGPAQEYHRGTQPLLAIGQKRPYPRARL